MDIISTAGLVFGVLAVAVALFIYLSRSRRVILLTKLTDDILWAVHYLLIGGFTATALNLIGVVREIVFFNRGKKWASSKIWLYVFLAAVIVAGILTWEGYPSLLALAGMIFAVFSFWCKAPLLICCLSIPSELCWLCYNIIHASVPGMISSNIAILSAVIGIIRNLRAEKTEKTE